MADLRTKINELPICENVDLIDTLIAIGTDGKSYRVNKDSVGVGGSKLTPIAGEFGIGDGVSNIYIKNPTLIDYMINNGGGTVHVLMLNNKGGVIDAKINLSNNRPVSPQTLSLEPSNLNYSETFIASSYININDNQILIVELHDFSIVPRDISATSDYVLYIYKINLSHIQEVEEFIKTDDGTGTNPSNYYGSSRDIMYANYKTIYLNMENILNVCLEDKPIYGQSSLIERRMNS